jgi:hypothetical protein
MSAVTAAPKEMRLNNQIFYHRNCRLHYTEGDVLDSGGVFRYMAACANERGSIGVV